MKERVKKFYQSQIGFVLILAAWYVLASLALGIFGKWYITLGSSWDSVTYYLQFKHRTAFYPAIIKLTGGGLWLWITQAIVWLATILITVKAARSRVAGIILALNLGMLALTYHALTETFAIFFVACGLWAYDRRKWPLVFLALCLLTYLKPVIPLPIEAWRGNAEMALERFKGQAAAMGGYIFAYLSNVCSNIFAWSNFTPKWMRIPTFGFTSAVWIVATISWIERKDWKLFAFIAFYVCASGISFNQGDRLLIPLMPVLAYIISNYKAQAEALNECFA